MAVPTMSQMITFLDLPEAVRRQIYLAAGVVRICPIDLMHERERVRLLDTPGTSCFYREKRFHDIRRPAYNSRFCCCAPIPTSLLRVSKAILGDVFRILYSENKFHVELDLEYFAINLRQGVLAHGSMYTPENKCLAPLAAFRLMESLSIRLNSCSCIKGDYCASRGVFCPVNPSMCVKGADDPLSKKKCSETMVLQKWAWLCGILAATVQPQLRLSVLCDTATVSIAKKVAEPLINLPSIKQCSIRLGQSRNDVEIRQVAENTVLYLTNRLINAQAMIRFKNLPKVARLQRGNNLIDRFANTQDSFRFVDLPIEIQMEILAHTDLVAPFPLLKLTDRPRLYRAIKNPTSCCMRCSEALNYCSCVVRHAAYSSNGCECWRFPLSILQASRDTHAMGMEIFYSKNIFAIVEVFPDILATWPLLTSIRGDGTRHLRFIYWRFDDPFLIERTPEQTFTAWWQCIEFLAGQRAGQSRGLTVAMEFQALWSLSGTAAEKYEEARIPVRRRMVEPFRNLRNLNLLQNFFVFLTKDFYVSSRMNDLRLQGFEEREIDEQERALEREVMGEGYDSPTQKKKLVKWG